MAVTFDNVHKVLRQKNKKTVVFEAACVSFGSDKISGILANPGTGKTTASQLVTGKLRPDLGSVRRSSLVSFPVGGGGVFNGMLTGRENLAFLCRVFGFDPRPIIRFVVEFAELGNVIDKQFKFYNRDERTKLMFASSYGIPFDTYIVDESLIGGRGKFRGTCEELALERMRSAGFIIFSSSPKVIQKYCSDFFIIDRLKLHQVASIDDAISLLGESQLRDGEGYTELVADGGDANEI
jgi:capsular polysaccharide transport system ATP-binding protein